MERPLLHSPEDELAYLRAQVAQKERELAQQTLAVPERAQVVSEQVHAYAQLPHEEPARAHQMGSPAMETAAQDILSQIENGNQDAALESLVRAVEEKGVKNALSVLDKVTDPRLADDFHRFLVRYIGDGLLAAPLEKGPRFQALRMTLYAIALPAPRNGADAQHRPLKELISSMEQLYAGLASVEKAIPGEPPYIAFELAVPADSPELHFFAAVPNGKRDLFEKQVLAIYPTAHLVPQPYDYNLFVPNGVQASSMASLAESPALPLKDYGEFDYDPLNALLNAFAKIAHENEGAALQFIIEPRGDRHIQHYRKMLSELRKGEKAHAAFSTPETMLGELARDFGRSLFSTKPKDDDPKVREETGRQIEENRVHIEQIEKKISSPVVGATIRLAVSTKEPAKAGQLLSELEAAFNQFTNTNGNRIEFVRTPARRAAAFLDDFSFRLPSASALPLSLRELTTLYHFPPHGIESSPHLKQTRFTHAPAPLSLPHEGVLLGVNTFRATETPVRLELQDRLRHLYVIGQTGTGKTVCLKNLIAQDIANGDGCCFIDPHGNDILDILANVPPERYDDVIYFDPADLSRPLGLNFLEYDLARPEQKTFIVNELLAIFHRLYGDVPESMGPAFEQYFRNATQLVMEDPSSGSTILDISRVLSNANFRNLKLSRSMNPIVNQFWTEIATKAGGEASLENIVPYITNKFDEFSANDFIRPIIGQQESSFNFRDVIDSRKILLVNLSKGRLGERNANLLGLIIVGKLFMAALSRADNPRAAFPPFFLYIDEFQNITTDSIPGILSEARKYKLSLSMAHQFLSQVDSKIREAVFGNVGNMAVFRVGEEDAEFFAKQFAPTFDAQDFVGIENYNAYVKILAKGVPQPPFDLRTPTPSPGNPAQIDDLIHLSAMTYGRDRATVESMIRERYLSRAAYE